jgi:chromosome segregation ATPase
MEQVWTDVDAAEPNGPEAEAWTEPTTPEEIWGAASTEQVEAEARFEPEHTQFQSHAEEPSFEAPASFDGDQHEASVGRIDDLLARIHEGASTFVGLRSQIDGLSESLRTTEETLADRERRIGELVQEHESDQRRIEELVGQLGEREEALHGLSSRVEELTGRLGSAEERLDEREQRLAELDTTLNERMQHVDELSRQLERRDHALSSFEEKLNAIAAHFAA